MKDGGRLTDSAHKNIKRPALDIRRTTKVDQLDIALTIKHHILVFDVSMHDLRFGMQMMNRLGNLYENLPALLLFHVDPKLNVVEEIHAR